MAARVVEAYRILALVGTKMKEVVNSGTADEGAGLAAAVPLHYSAVAIPFLVLDALWWQSALHVASLAPLSPCCVHQFQPPRGHDHRPRSTRSWR